MCGDVHKDVPKDALELVGKFVTLVSCFDANLRNCVLTGRAATGAIHLLNQTPIDGFSKKQSTVETLTHGAKFLARGTCVEQAIDPRTTPCHLGVWAQKGCKMFGNNKLMVGSGTIPDLRLHKWHITPSQHQVQEVTALSVHCLCHINGDLNPADTSLFCSDDMANIKE